MLNRNKRGGIASLMSLFVATIVIVIVLVGFIAISVVVKKVEKINNEVGVGDVDEYMKNYALLLNAERFVKKGQSIDDALESSGYVKRPDTIQYGGSYGRE